MYKSFFSIVFLIHCFSLYAQNMDIQGHRGARGLFPENTIKGFVKALDLGVTTIELDVVVSADGQLVVSHDPFLNHVICLDTIGNPISKADERKFNLYKMPYAKISLCDCGSLGNPAFPDQEKQKAKKPLLSDVIKAVEWHIKSYTQYEVDYNIELKSSAKTDHINHPLPEVFSNLVYDLIDKYIPLHRVIIQSFDFRVLNYWHKQYPDVRLAVLVDNIKSIDTNLANLGFKPHFYSPQHKLLTEQKVRNLQQRGIKVIPWTVNDKERMEKLVLWRVDGFITDYPNRAQELGVISAKRKDND